LRFSRVRRRLQTLQAKYFGGCYLDVSPPLAAAEEPSTLCVSARQETASRARSRGPQLPCRTYSGCPEASLDSLSAPKWPQGFPLNYKPRRLDSLNPCSISFSDQFPREPERIAKEERSSVGAATNSTPPTLSADIGFSFSPRDPSGVASFETSGAESKPEIPLLLAPSVLIANDYVLYVTLTFLDLEPALQDPPPQLTTRNHGPRGRAVVLLAFIGGIG
jgi:hypothetical protein